MTLSFRRVALKSSAVALLLALFSLPTAVFAQEEEGEDGEAFRDCSDEALTEMREDLSDSPATRDLLPSGLEPGEAEAIRSQIYEVKSRQIVQLNEMLRDMPADYERRADLLFRLAEAHWEIADADHMAARAVYNACVDDWMMCIRDEECEEPLPEYSAALDQYREILRDHPDYERYDEVLFRLGDGLILADEPAEGVQYLTRLTNNYPESRFIPEARFLMGEHYFDNDLLIAARQNYEDVLNFPTNAYYNFAIYKIAWIDLNEHEYRESVQRFQTVIANIDELERTQGEVRFDLRADSINDMLRAWTEIDNGWVEARQYLREHEGEEVMRRKLLAMSELYNDKGKDEERIALTDWFIETYPTDPAIPDWMENISLSLTNIGNWDRYEGRIREFVQYLDPNATWAIVNGDNDRAMANARIFAESSFLGVIQRNYEEATRLSRQELFEEVADDYREFFDRWPDSEEAYEQRFFYAEILYYRIEDFPAAGEQYLEVVRMNQEGEHAHDAIIGALQAFDDLMKTEVPDIDEERPLLSQADLDVMREQGLLELDLGPWSQRYVEVVEFFAELFPNDERIPVASWRAAEIYRRANRIEEAAFRFETIIEHHPTHRFAEEAAISAFLCFQFAENWERIEHWARFLLEQNMEGTEFDAERLRRAIAYAINEQAQDLVESGEEFEAAEIMLSLYREFPDSEWSPNALYNAAAIYERARRVDTAVETYTTFLDAYPAHESVPEAQFTLGLIFDSQAEFADAADWFEIAYAHEGYPLRVDAVYNAARLREALSEYDRAIELYDAYLGHAGDPEISPAILFKIAQIELDRGNLDATYDRYSQIRQVTGVQPSVQLAATVLQARIRDEQGRTRDALELYESAYDQYGPGTLIFAEDTGLPTEWETPAGWQFEDRDSRVAALPFAAEARFRLADVDVDACQSMSLEYPAGRWRRLQGNLESRGEALETAQQAMFEVWWLGDAAWSVAAMGRIGELYQKFYNDMYTLPVPDLDECLDDGFSYDDCEGLDDAYNTMMYDIMYPIETKARESFSEALAIAHDNGVYNEWTQQAVEQMTLLDRNIRVVGEEGVDPDNVGVLYSGASYMTDLDAVLERFEILEAEAAELRRQQMGPPTGETETETEGEGQPPEATEDGAPEAAPLAPATDDVETAE